MHTFQAQPARLQKWTDNAHPLWHSPQLATPNQHRSGLTLNEQVSLKLSVRLQRLQDKPADPVCQNTVGKVSIISATFINVHEKFPGTFRSSGTSRAPKIEGGIQRSIQMPVCRAIRRPHVLQMQLMTVSGRLSRDPSFSGMPTTRAATETWGNQKYPGDQGARKARS